MHGDVAINYCFFSLLLLIFGESGSYDPVVVSAVNALLLPKKKKKKSNLSASLFIFPVAESFVEKIFNSKLWSFFFVMQSFNSLKLAVIPSTLILFTVCKQSAESKSALGLNRL